MVLFRPELIEKNLRGEKWETRRVWEKPMVRVGGVYAIARRFMEPKNDAPAWMLVTALRQEPVRAITNEGGVAEGYKSRADFLAAWERNFERTNLDQNVYVVTYIVVPVGFNFERGVTTLPCANCENMVRLHAKRDFWEHESLDPQKQCMVAYPRRMSPEAISAGRQLVEMLKGAGQ